MPLLVDVGFALLLAAPFRQGPRLTDGARGVGLRLSPSVLPPLPHSGADISAGSDGSQRHHSLTRKATTEQQGQSAPCSQDAYEDEQIRKFHRSSVAIRDACRVRAWA
ncbi:hypothetical protein [Streptomyces sp. NPDC058451]|uniref:hypothetical protein n=1 Tax=Streptomyces sp. NPDC058451 TaxID=3346506 RepID=UPI0036470015